MAVSHNGQITLAAQAGSTLSNKSLDNTVVGFYAGVKWRGTDNVVKLLLRLNLKEGGVALEAKLICRLPRVGVLAAPQKATQPKKW